MDLSEDELERSASNPEITTGKVRFVSAVAETKKYEAAPLPSQDRALANSELGLFGVFDGLGSKDADGLGRAPQAARDAIEAYFKATVTQPQSLEDILESMRQAFTAGRRVVTSGATTAVIAKYYEIEGQGYWGIANAGDSTLYAYNTQSAEYKVVTTEQGYIDSWGQSRVANFFESSPDDETDTPDEFIVIPASPTTRLALFTDGITGSLPDERLTEQEFLEGFAKNTPQAAAQAFLALSRKEDDKTVVVVDTKSAERLYSK